jgi:hypothetical protein
MDRATYTILPVSFGAGRAVELAVVVRNSGEVYPRRSGHMRILVGK